MKKVLVTGAAGCLGKLVIKYLLSEGKYEITAIDMKNRNSYKVLKKYNKRINIIYGDITDPILIDAVVKEHDYIIHLASINPILTTLNKKVSEEIDYKGTENIVRAITFYNPKCFLIYPSTTNIYGKRNKEVSTNDRGHINEMDYYTLSKSNCEKLIKNKLSNYVIYRLPNVLTNLNKENFSYNMINNNGEFITDIDAAYGLVKSIEMKNSINKKVYNLTGGINCRITSNELLIEILKIYGLSKKFLWAKIFMEKTFIPNEFSDSQKIENILHYQNDSISSYLMRLKRQSKNTRKINCTFAKPFIYIMKKRNSK